MMNKHLFFALATTVILALLILVTNTTVLSIFGGTINSPQTFYEDVGVPEGEMSSSELLLLGITDIIGTATTSGLFIRDVTASSADNQCSIYIPIGTTGLTIDLRPLTRIIIIPNTSPPEPPSNSSFIGTAYNTSPEGATFYPTITVSLNYDPDNLPVGVKEEDLAIVVYNKSSSKWVNISNIKVDNTKHNITGETNYFSTFSILAY